MIELSGVFLGKHGRVSVLLLVLLTILLVWWTGRSREQALYIQNAAGILEPELESMRRLARENQDQFWSEVKRTYLPLTAHQVRPGTGLVLAVRTYRAPSLVSLTSSHAGFMKMTVFVARDHINPNQEIQVPEDAKVFLSAAPVMAARRAEMRAGFLMYWGASGKIVIEQVSEDAVTATFDVVLEMPQRTESTGDIPSEPFRLDSTEFAVTSVERLSAWEGRYTDDPRKGASPLPGLFRFLAY